MEYNSGMISVIIPVYKVEKYLEKCLLSVCNQTYKNLEIIVIDDESPDSCGMIAEGLAKKDSRIKVIHQKNRGAAGARNAGLDICSGEFIMFVDSDDWLEVDMAEKLLCSMKENNCEIVQCSYYDEYVNETKTHIKINEGKVVSAEGFMEDALSNWEDILIWNKLFKRECMGDIRFVEGRCIDDEFYTYKTIINAKKIYMGTECLYHYRIRKSGAMGSEAHKKQRCIDAIDFVTGRYEDVVKTFPGIEARVLEHLCGVLMEIMRKCGEFPDVYRKAKSELSTFGRRAFLKPISKGLKKSIMIYLFKSVVSQEKNDYVEQTENYFE